MKKIIAMTCLLLGLGTWNAYAVQESEGSQRTAPDSQNSFLNDNDGALSRPQALQKPRADVPSGGLPELATDQILPAAGSQTVSEKPVNLWTSQIQAQLQAIERRIGDLERDLRFQEDHLRSVERSVDDLKRRSS